MRGSRVPRRLSSGKNEDGPRSFVWAVSLHLPLSMTVAATLEPWNGELARCGRDQQFRMLIESVSTQESSRGAQSRERPRSALG